MSETRMVQLCGGGRCPRVFQRDDGSWVVQGLNAAPETIESLNPVAGEGVVELPKSVVAELVAKLTML